MNAPEQLSMFEPEGAEALALMKRHKRAYEAAIEQADLYQALWCPGARDEALRQAQAAFRSWLVLALLLDIEREAAL
jgi:hypothetical protein